MIEINKKIKVALGMSGGVDSSVAALLLKEQGYNVIGFFMKLWHDPKCDITRENACCDEKALADARAVAKQLDIPFYVVDARQAFKELVTDYFINEYKNLRTPNPCVICNQKIKFGWLLDYANKLDCDFLATGHYSRIVKEEKLFKLVKGVDQSRDQSYFLWQLNQGQLSKIIFPLGEMQKSDVRTLARENNLPVFEKVESREICFIDDDYRLFLHRYLGGEYFEPGRIVDKSGFTVGEHNGLINYTIGQRKGIAQYKVHGKEGTETQPLYVIGFNKEKNELIVGDDTDLYRDEFEIESTNLFMNPTEIKNSKNLTVKVRYKAEEAPCLVIMANEKVIIKLEKPVRAVTPGQSAVVYFNDQLVLGGIIK